MSERRKKITRAVIAVIVGMVGAGLAGQLIHLALPTRPFVVGAIGGTITAIVLVLSVSRDHDSA